MWTQGNQHTKENHMLSGQARSVGEMDFTQCLLDEGEKGIPLD